MELVHLEPNTAPALVDSSKTVSNYLIGKDASLKQIQPRVLGPSFFSNRNKEKTTESIQHTQTLENSFGVCVFF